MVINVQEKVTVVLPHSIKQEVVKLKETLRVPMSTIYQTAIIEYVEKMQRRQVQIEAQEMVSEYETNPEMLELASFGEK
jgi:predicted transcriptional regulator